MAQVKGITALPSQEMIIKTDNLVKNYGAVHALKGLTLQIKEGEIFGLIGPNGAGKTTLFRLLLGLIPPTAGEITVYGHNVTQTWDRNTRSLLGYLPENISFYNNMSALETMYFYAGMKGVSKDAVQIILEKVGLKNAADRKVVEFSKGMRQRLGLAQALMGDPKILFLDEPTSGLDPEGIATFYSIINESRKQGTTVIMTSHILRDVQHRVDRLGIMGNGQLLAAGTVHELRSSLQLRTRLEMSFIGQRMDHDSLKAIRDAVVKAGGQCIHEDDNGLLMDFSEQDKLDILSAVMKFKTEILDLEIVEPSLEDIFSEYICRMEKD